MEVCEFNAGRSPEKKKRRRGPQVRGHKLIPTPQLASLSDSRRRGGHSSVSADSLGGRDRALLQSLGQDPHVAALSARLQGATQGPRHRRVRGRKRRVHATPDAARVLSGNA